MPHDLRLIPHNLINPIDNATGYDRDRGEPRGAFGLARAGGHCRRGASRGLDRLGLPPFRCRANMAHIRQSRPDSGLGVLAKVFERVEVIPFPLGFVEMGSARNSRTPDNEVRSLETINF